jgi:two-component system chemotaxis response regulator CheB
MAARVSITADELPGARPAAFGCPACHGALFELPDAPPVRYRCRVGHAWSADSLLAEQSDELESALGVALRALKEKAALSDRLARHATNRGSEAIAHRYRLSGAEVERAAAALRELIERLGRDGDNLAERLSRDAARTDGAPNEV